MSACEARLSVQPTPEAPRRVRTWLSDLDCLEPSTCEVLKLLLTELVGNSVRHAALDPDDQIEVKIDRWPLRVRAEVSDPGSGINVDLSEPKPEVRGSGWGFVLVEQLSDRWGLETNGHSTVWFEVSTAA